MLSSRFKYRRPAPVGLTLVIRGKLLRSETVLRKSLLQKRDPIVAPEGLPFEEEDRNSEDVVPVALVNATIECPGPPSDPRLLTASRNDGSTR